MQLTQWQSEFKNKLFLNFDIKIQSILLLLLNLLCVTNSIQNTLKISF